MERLFGNLSTFPRIRLGRLPTPIEQMSNLQKRLETGPLFVKRDDCTDFAMGGNKVRQMEFYLGEAKALKADTILITGAIQSNFVRVAAAGARKLGMDCHIQLEERVPKNDTIYRNSGNVLLNRILGATLHSYPKGEDEQGADLQVRKIANELESRGKRPYIIPLGPGHIPLGALAYVLAARELLDQMKIKKFSVDEIVVPSGSGHTHGGLLFGLRALGSQIQVTGICVRRNATAQQDRIRARCREIGEILGIQSQVTEKDIHLYDRFLTPGYGQMNQTIVDSIRISAHTEGLILDPVYSGRTMAGLIHRAQKTKEKKTFLFLHTGGNPSLFAYGPELTKALAIDPV